MTMQIPNSKSQPRLNRSQIAMKKWWSLRFAHWGLERGFTLLELIVVIGIISILSLLLLTVVNPFEQFKKADDAKRKSDLTQIQKVLEQYYQDFGSYPQSSNYKILDFKSNQVIDWGESWQPYINIMPQDSDPNRMYIYLSSSADGYQSYRLYTSLERGGSDSQACQFSIAACHTNPNSVNCKCAAVPNGVSCGNNSSYICNFGVSSPNVSL